MCLPAIEIQVGIGLLWVDGSFEQPGVGFFTFVGVIIVDRQTGAFSGWTRDVAGRAWIWGVMAQGQLRFYKRYGEKAGTAFRRVPPAPILYTLQRSSSGDDPGWTGEYWVEDLQMGGSTELLISSHRDAVSFSSDAEYVKSQGEEVLKHDFLTISPMIF